MRVIKALAIVSMILTGCAANTPDKDKDELLMAEAEEASEDTKKEEATPTASSKPNPVASNSTATAKTTTDSTPKPSPTATPKATPTPIPTPAPTPEPEWKEESYSAPQESYTEVWTEPEYYEEPVQEYQTYTDTSGASSYNGQYPGVSCEGVAGLYLGGDMSYVLASYGYQVWDPQPNDVIAYFDGGWNYRHTAVFLGNGQALHGSYNSDKSAQVASMYIGGYPNLCYFRIGGDTCYTQFLNDVAQANGGRAGWLEGITFPLG